MKWGFVIILSVLLPLLCACGSRSYPPSLLRVDSLASVCPDSALSLLKALERDTAVMPLSHRMYYRLLCVKAADKAYLPHTSDSVIRPLIHYYIEEGDPRLLPEAYYYAGRVYRDLGDAPQALDYFERSLEAMRKHENLKIKNKVYAQMGTLFLYQDMYPEALEAFKQSFRCKIELKDSLGMIFSYRDIANCYRNLEQPDSALYYFRQAGNLCREVQRMDMYQGVQSQLASFYIDLGKYDSAYSALQVALQNVEDSNQSGIYSIAAEFYRDIGKTDSAIWYNQELFRMGTIYAKQAAARDMAEFARVRNDISQTFYYLDQYILYTDSVDRLNSRDEVRRNYAHYNYQLREKEVANLKVEIAKKRREKISIAIGSVVLLTFLSLYYGWKRKQLSKRLRMAEQFRVEAYHRSDQFIRDNQAEVSRLEEEKQVLQRDSSIYAEDIERLDKLQEVIGYTNQQVRLEQDKRRARESLLYNSEVYCRFKYLLETSTRPTDEDWRTLQKQIDACYENFTLKLNGLRLLNRTELRVSWLIKLNFKKKEIATLLSLSPESISSIRRRLYEKVFHQKGASKDWDLYIDSL